MRTEALENSTHPGDNEDIKEIRKQREICLKIFCKWIEEQEVGEIVKLQI